LKVQVGATAQQATAHPSMGEGPVPGLDLPPGKIVHFTSRGLWPMSFYRRDCTTSALRYHSPHS
jgi:hypothetical protein